MQIRLAGPADAAGISDLILRLIGPYIRPDMTAVAASEPLTTIEPDELARSLASRHYRYHVAEEMSGIVGVVGVRKNVQVVHLFVATAHHRQGIARRLWQTAREACESVGAYGPYRVNASTYAVPVYERLGFVRTGPPVVLGGITSTPMAWAAPNGPDPGMERVP